VGASPTPVTLAEVGNILLEGDPFAGCLSPIRVRFARQVTRSVVFSRWGGQPTGEMVPLGASPGPRPAEKY